MLDCTKWNHNDIDTERPDWPGSGVLPGYLGLRLVWRIQIKNRHFNPRHVRQDHGQGFSSLYLWNYLSHRDVINCNQMALGWTQQYKYSGHHVTMSSFTSSVLDKIQNKRQYFYGNVSQEIESGLILKSSFCSVFFGIDCFKDLNRSWKKLYVFSIQSWLTLIR